MALSLPWRTASPTASRRSSLRVSSKERAIPPISSEESTSIGTRSNGAPSLLSLFSPARRTVSASRAPASSEAPIRSRYSGCNTDLVTTIVNHDASAATMITATPAASTDRMALSRTEPPAS